MIFVSYTKTDSYYEFVGENGNKQIYPVGSIILTDDESGMIAIKNTASRQTIGLVVKPEPPFSGKFKLTLNDSSTVTAECDSTSAITSGEVATQYSGSVVSAEIGDCVTSIGNSAFLNCRNLASIDIPSSITSIGNSAFFNCGSLASVNIPTGVTTIGSSTFRDCRNLTSINLPSSVTSIDSRAFYQCTGLTSCTIGSGVTSIGDSAFNKCSGLTSITVEATTPPTLVPYRGVYENFLYTNDCPILVPAASVDTYKAAEGWSDYASRIQAIV